MKEIKAIIRPHMLHKVMEAPHGLPHFPGVTISDCQGQGRGRGSGEHYEATEESIYLARMTKLEMFCTDDVCEEIVGVIRGTAHTGNPDDGLIALVDLPYVTSIRTGKEQEKAV